MKVPGIKLYRQSGLAAITFTHWATLLARLHQILSICLMLAPKGKHRSNTIFLIQSSWGEIAQVLWVIRMLAYAWQIPQVLLVPQQPEMMSHGLQVHPLTHICIVSSGAQCSVSC